MGPVDAGAEPAITIPGGRLTTQTEDVSGFRSVTDAVVSHEGDSSSPRAGDENDVVPVDSRHEIHAV